MEKKDKNKTTTIKQTFSYGKSKTVTVEVIKKKDNKNKFPSIKETSPGTIFNKFDSILGPFGLHLLMFFRCFCSTRFGMMFGGSWEVAMSILYPRHGI